MAEDVGMTGLFRRQMRFWSILHLQVHFFLSQSIGGLLGVGSSPKSEHAIHVYRARATVASPPHLRVGLGGAEHVVGRPVRPRLAAPLPSSRARGHARAAGRLFAGAI
jgi:hypothetical protein